MDNIREMWSLPWHALQRSLARGICVEAAADCAATLEGLKVQRATHPAGSWLGRARRRAEPMPTL
jgi:hypothetical protein